MKNRNVFLCSLVIIVALGWAACTSLDDVHRRLDEHDERLAQMEESLKGANTSIQSLQQLLDAEARKLSIVSYEKVENVGYVLKMSDGSTITLRDGEKGKDGAQPEIGTKKGDDGVLYWTINGDFMRDADGNTVKAEGHDGADGTAPQLRINSEGYWEVSRDGGKTWQAMTDERGSKVKARGSDARVDLSITEDEHNIIIIYNGQRFVLPKGNVPPVPPVVGGHLNPLSLVAERNMAQTSEGAVFAASNANEGSGYYAWDDAMARFGEVLIGGQPYHLPSRDEWLAIICSLQNVRFDNTGSASDVNETVEILSEKGTWKADYKNVGGVAYGLRYKESDTYRSAWRYQFIDNPSGAGGGKMMRISAVSVGADQGVDLVANPIWWEGRDSVVVRDFPAAGWMDDRSSLTAVGKSGYYWSSTEYDSSFANYMYFDDAYAFGGDLYVRLFANSVRLFKGKRRAEPTPPVGEAILPLALVAERNMADTKEGAAFAADNTNDGSGYYSWSEATARFSRVSIEGEDYHLPSREEWMGIVGASDNARFDNTASVSDVSETVEVNGIKGTYKADYKNVGGVSYGLRYKDCDTYRSAWRYDFIPNPEGEGSALRITAILVEPTATIADVATPEWWSSARGQDSLTVRLLPACGWAGGRKLEGIGTEGHYWSNTPFSTQYASFLFFDKLGVNAKNLQRGNARLVVRLFSSKKVGG